MLTDHSWSLTIANGLSPAQVEQQHRLIGELNERFAREEAAGEAPEGGHPDGFRLLHGCEMEIRIDGRLDYDDAVLARFDVVVASLHVGRRQPRAQLMARYETAFRNPHVDIIAHPRGARSTSGRTSTWTGIASMRWRPRPARCSRSTVPTSGSTSTTGGRAALDAGCRFTIDSDAHYLSEWDNVIWGTNIARRGWLEARHVANTLPPRRVPRAHGGEATPR
ncbi:MAG: hypothetical protein R3C32_10480 [Chloroflexota bacterium]